MIVTDRYRPALDVAVFAGILLLGLSRVPEPLFGDQALSLLMGQLIAEGGTPYLDLWDPKYPGIFFFFAAGGTLFGFNEIGIHSFELLWMLVLSVCVRVLAAHYVRHGPIASLTPLLTVGAYYGGTTSYHLTQVEAVVALPLLLSLVATAAATRNSERQFAWLFASGLSAGVVLIFQPLYLTLPVLFWFLAGIERQRDGRISAVLRTLALPLLMGMVVPATITMFYVAAKPGVNLMWWTFVVYPREATSECPLQPQRVLDGILWFARTFRVLIALAVVGLWTRWRSGWDLLTSALVVWVAVGVLLIWIQVLSWWSYQYLLLLVPTGLLAAPGLESLWLTTTRPATVRWTRALAAASLLALSMLLVRQVRPVAVEAAAIFSARPLPLNSASMSTYWSNRSRAYANDLATISVLREPGSHEGPVYVFAVPNLYQLAGRRPAIRWLAAWFRPTRELWNQLITELEKAAPPYILVNNHELEFIAYQNPALRPDLSLIGERLQARYRVLRTTVGGTWYIRLDLAAGPQ